MKIGDRVRLLKGTEEGRIINFRKGNIVEIEIEDGFIIPVLRNEIVLIDRRESEIFGYGDTEKEIEEKQNNLGALPKGTYLALKETDDNTFVSYLINETDDIILYTISQYDKKLIYGKSYGICTSHSMAETGILTSSILNDSKRLLIQVIVYETETKLKKQPITKELLIRATDLNEKVYLQSISENVALIKIEENPAFSIDPEILRDKMLNKNSQVEQEKIIEKKQIEQTIDLHIDASTTQLNPNQILEYQINEFEKAYDNALVMNLEKLKIIHGVGAGILRKEIHKRLSQKSEVKYFEDADKERFGFGSTIIYF